MQHKALRLIIILLFVVASQGTEAQNLTKSPYSIIGVGEMHFVGTTLQSSMGQIGQGLRRPSDINVLNPASYSALRNTVIDGGVSYSQGRLSKTSASSDVDNYSFAYFNIAVPLSIKQRIGMAFGLSPYSNIGYDVSTATRFDGYESSTEMQGSGGLSRFYLGAGGQVVRNFSIGFNGSYIFGQINRDQQLFFPEGTNRTNIAETRRRIVGDLQFQVAAQYHRDFFRGLERRDQYTFVAGASYTLGSTLNAKEEYFIRSMGVGGVIGSRDTIAYIERNDGTIVMPYALSGGISLEKKDKWMIAVDASYSDWSAYRAFGRTDSLQNSFGFSAGGSYIPNAADYKSYFKRVEYRAGARFESGNLELAGKDISTYGISAGVGLPLSKSRSRFNISAEYFVRGTTQNNLIREDYFRVIFGINFSDLWFQRKGYE